MRRIDLRTPDAWRAYDMWSGIIALLIPLFLLSLWVIGVTPPMSACCGGRAPLTSLPGQRAAPDVEITALGDKVLLRGRVADAGTRASLVAAAQAAFGATNVTDSLTIDSSRASLSWANSAKDMLADFRDMPRPASILSYGSVVTLSGSVETDADKALRGTRARKFFGEKVTISNGITVKGAALVVVPKIDCTSLTRGAQIVFQTASAELDDKARAVLDGIAPCLIDGNWEVGGHTDSRGSEEANESLSLERATSVVAYMTQRKGASNLALSPVGYGANEPVADNGTDDGRAQNRRITFKRN
jgi:OmpA-OmpF porin, OOP family